MVVPFKPKDFTPASMAEHELEIPQPLTEEQIDALIGEWDAKLFYTVVAMLQDEHGISAANWERINELINHLGGLEADIAHLRNTVQSINGRFYLPEERK